MAKAAKPERIGAGVLLVVRERQNIAFRIKFKNSLDGRGGGEGSVTGDPDAMRQAFREGRTRLTLDDGGDLDVEVIAHSDGSPTAYFRIC